jgi:hypothetical protein
VDPVPRAWASADVAIVVPTATARAMFDRARRHDLAGGGRFEAHGAAVLLWSATEPAEGAEPLGAFYIYWRTPDVRHATVHRLAWDPDQGGSQAEVRRAIAVLGGPRT